MVKYVYDAWGNHKVLNANGVEITDTTHIGHVNPIRYRSYYYDTETGLYYLNARYYDPETCRFISPDSVDYLDPETIGGTNLYAYCNNNPVMNIDPTGHDWWHWLVSGLQIIGGIALCFVPGAQAIGFSMIVGGSLGLIANAAAPAIAQAIGGASSMANGWGAFSTGISILSFGTPGIIAGIGLMLVGFATMAFGANEIVSAFSGTNYIQEWTGMSDSAYGWAYAGLNLLSSIGQAVERFYNMYQTRTPNLNSKTGELKGYRYYDSKGRKLFDVDYSHSVYGNPNIKFPHYHAWWLDGSRHGKNHTGYLIMILELFGR